MSVERRNHPRFPIRIQAEVGFPTWDVFKLIYTINISKGGMNLELPEKPPVGARLGVRLVLPSGLPVEIQAVVRHVTAMPAVQRAVSFTARFEVGVEFQDLDDAKRALIEQTIRDHAGR